MSNGVVWQAVVEGVQVVAALFGPVAVVLPRRPPVLKGFHTILIPPSNPTEGEYSQALLFAGFVLAVVHVDAASLSYTRTRLHTLVRMNYPCLFGSTLHAPLPRESERLPCTNGLVVCTLLQNLARARERETAD